MMCKRKDAMKINELLSCLEANNFSDEVLTFQVDNHLVTTDKEFTLPAHGYHIIFSVGDCFGDCDESEFEDED